MILKAERLIVIVLHVFAISELTSQILAPRGRAVKSAVSYSLDHLAAVSSLGSSPALAIYETIKPQVLLAGMPGSFSRGSPVFAQPTDWPVSYELK